MPPILAADGPVPVFGGVCSTLWPGCEALPPDALARRGQPHDQGALL